MNLFWKILIGLVLIIAAIILLHRFYVQANGPAAIGSTSGLFKLPTLEVATSTSATVTADTPTQPAQPQIVTLSGTAIMDDSGGLPAVPFIAYQNNGATSTKQLIFVDERGCLPNAGDIPCVPTYAESSAYPQLSDGEQISVTGYIQNDRFLVTGLAE